MLKEIEMRVNSLIELGKEVLDTSSSHSHNEYPHHFDVDEGLFAEFKVASLSFLKRVFGLQHIYYEEYNKEITISSEYCTKKGLGILKAAKREVDNNWLFSIKELVSAEIFLDFLEMAEHLLEGKYKDAAAVMIGSILEEHLRQLAIKNLIAIVIVKNNKSTPKRANTLNDELAKKNVYNKLDQKSILAWLDLRNKAAHGHYSEYTQKQVEFMYQGVSNFLSRVN